MILIERSEYRSYRLLDKAMFLDVHSIITRLEPFLVSVNATHTQDVAPNP